MKYYFSLTNENAENFYSTNWIVLESSRIFGGGVIIKTPNNGNKLFRCNKLCKDTFHTLFEIDLSEDDVEVIKDFEDSGKIGITLIKLTNDKTIGNYTYTVLHQTANFGYAMTKPEWSWDVKPLTMKPVKPECNIAIDIPKDFIPPYSVADSRISMLEVLKEMSMFESDRKVRIPEIKEVIFNKPATVVYWKDGDKTKVKCGKDEESFDREKAVAMCLIKKMLKPYKKCHWLDVIHDAIKAADDKIAKAEADKAEKARIKAENIAKAEEAKRKKAEKKAAALKEEIQTLEKNENDSNERKELFETIQKENNKVVLNKNGKVKIDQDLMLECIKEKLTIDEIAEMNSWDKAAVARMYYKITGTKPEKKPNTYSELDALFEQGVSVDAAARRTGFSKNIVAMRYAKLQNKNNIKE